MMGHPAPPEDPIEWGDDCFLCEAGRTPKDICAKIIGMVNTCLPRAGGRSIKAFGIAEAVNGFHRQVPQIAPCRWFGHFCGDFGYLQTYSVPNCEEGHELVKTDILGISIDVIKKNPTQLRIEVEFEFVCGVTTGAYLFFSDPATIGSHCVQISNVGNEQTLNTPQGGTLSIKEGPCI